MAFACSTPVGRYPSKESPATLKRLSLAPAATHRPPCSTKSNSTRPLAPKFRDGGRTRVWPEPSVVADGLPVSTLFYTSCRFSSPRFARRAASRTRSQAWDVRLIRRATTLGSEGMARSRTWSEAARSMHDLAAGFRCVMEFTAWVSRRAVGCRPSTWACGQFLAWVLVVMVESRTRNGHGHLRDAAEVHRPRTVSAIATNLPHSSRRADRSVWRYSSSEHS